MDITTLGIALDTSDLKQGESALNSAAGAATKAADALDAVTDSAAKTGSTLNGVADATQKTSVSASQLASSYTGVSQASNEAAASGQKYLASLKQEYDLLGLNRAETEAYIAQAKGLSQTQQEMAAALGAKIDAWSREEAASKAAAAAQERAAASADIFIAKLQSQVDAIGKTRAELLQFQAAQLGVSEQAAPLIAAIEAQSTALQTLGESEDQASARIATMVAASLEAQAAMTDSSVAAARYAASVDEMAAAATAAEKANVGIATSAREAAAAQAAATAEFEAASTTISAGAAKVAEALGRQLTALTATKAQMVEYDAQMAGFTEAETAQVSAIAKEIELRKQQIALGEEMAAMYATDAAAATGARVATSGVTSELLVLGREAANGNYTRLAGSFTRFLSLAGALQLLMNPLTLSVIAVGAAMLEVANQNEKMNEALVLTGSYAGITSDQLHAMAEAATAGGATFNTAAEAVTALAATGRLTGDEIANLGKTTADAATFTSVSVKQMVDDFTKLAEDPVKASVALNDQYHYLTVSTYDQITALMKQGDATGAAQVAVEAFSTAMDARTQDIAKNEGIILQGWRDIKGAISDAIQAVGSFGATASSGEIVARLQANKAARLPIGTWDQQDEADLQAALVKYNADVKTAQDKARADRQNQQVIDAKHSYDTWNSQFATPAEKRAKDIQSYIDTIATPLNLSPEQQIADESKINSKYPDKKTKSGQVGLIDKTQLTGEVQAVKDALAEELSDVSSAQKQLDALYKSSGVSEASYYQQSRDLAAQKATDEIDAYNKEAALLAKGLSDRNLSAAQRAQINNQIQSDQAKSSKATEDFFNAIADSAAKEDGVWQKYGQSQLDAMQKQIDAANQQDQGLKDQVATFGMTKSAIDDLKASRADDTVAALEQGRAIAIMNNNLADTKPWDDSIAKAKELAAALHGVASDQVALDVDAQIKKQQDDIGKSWQGTIDGIGSDFHNGFLQMLTDGKNGWDSFTKSLVNTFESTVVNELYQAFAKPFIVNVVANIAGLMGGSGIANQILSSNGMAGSALGGMNNLSSGYSMLTKGYGALSGYLGLGGTAAMTSGAASAVGGTLASGLGGTFATDIGGTVASSTAGIATAEGVGASGASTFGAGAGLTGAASSMGWVPVIGWILAGMAADSKLMGQGWNPDNGSISGVGKGIGSASLASYDVAKAIGIPSGIANILTGASTISRLFGRQDPKATSSGVDGVITVADGFQGQDYTDWTAKGGLFRSDAHGTVNGAATQDQKDMISGTIAGTIGTINQLGDAIGGIDGLQGKLSQFQYSIRNDWSNQTNVTKSLTDLSNSLVDAVIPLDQYQQTGETLTQTAVRLTGVFTSTNTLADMLGKTMTDAFGAVGIAGAQVRLNLVAAAGGIDNFNSEVSAYYSAYFSGAEQLSSAQDQMKQSFASLGIAMPQSKDAFRAVVSSLDLTTASGQNTFAALMALAPAFDQMTQSMQQAADAQQSLWNQYFSSIYTPSQQLAMSTKQLQDQFNALGVAMPKSNADFETLVENMDTSTQPMKDLQSALLALAPAFGQVMSSADQAAQAAQQSAAQNVQTALSDVQTAYNNQVQAINANITSITNFITQLTNLKQSLSLGSLSTLSPQDKYNAEKQLFDSTSAAAASGDATAQGNLPQVAQDFLTASQAYNASSQAYVDDYNAVQSALDRNIATAQQQLSAAQQQLDATNQMVQGILNLNQTTQSLADALKAYFAAQNAAGNNALGGTPSATGAGLNRSQIEATAVNGLIPYSADNPYGPMGGYSVSDWQNSMAGGVSDATKAALGMTQNANGQWGWNSVNGSHAGGADYIPFDGYRAELHKGEAVVTSANNQKLSQMLSIDWSRFGGNDQTALLNEIKALRAEVSATRQSQQTIAAVTLQQGQQQHAENRADMSKQTRHLQNTSDNTGKIAAKK